MTLPATVSSSLILILPAPVNEDSQRCGDCDGLITAAESLIVKESRESSIDICPRWHEKPSVRLGEGLSNAAETLIVKEFRESSIDIRPGEHGALRLGKFIGNGILLSWFSETAMASASMLLLPLLICCASTAASSLASGTALVLARWTQPSAAFPKFRSPWRIWAGSVGVHGSKDENRPDSVDPVDMTSGTSTVSSQATPEAVMAGVSQQHLANSSRPVIQ